ncbi:squalene synthase HpnC [Aquabacterium sp.]|uniref:squalene synthase HpnC n=1 Tax=Aquabacterium sp. TaxID=1872578 RepID=UPI003784C538
MATVSVDHYENFPVASVLCPPALRPAVQAIYHFARTADDLADEGDAAPTERIAALRRYRAALHASMAGQASTDWPGVFVPLARCVAHHGLSVSLLDDLIDAFVQDCGNPRYADRAQLLDYCRRSANPIGRLLLQLYRIDDALSVRQSDAICSALQLINFWQDPSVDLPRGRLYVPADAAQRHGLTQDQLLQQRTDTPATRALLRELCGDARALMLEGAPLACRLPGRMGWELRLVVQGGLRILERIERMNHGTLTRRPTVRGRDLPVMLWRALRMPGRTTAAARP